MYHVPFSYDVKVATEEDLVRQLVEAGDVDEVIERMELNHYRRVAPIVRSLSAFDTSGQLSSFDGRPSIVSPAPSEALRTMTRRSLPPPPPPPPPSPPLRSDAEMLSAPRDYPHTERSRDRSRHRASSRGREANALSRAYRELSELRTPERGPPQGRRGDHRRRLRARGEWPRPSPLESPLYVRDGADGLDDPLTATTEEVQTPHDDEEDEFDVFDNDGDEEEEEVAVIASAAPPRIIEREQHRRPRMEDALPHSLSPLDAPAPLPQPLLSSGGHSNHGVARGAQEEPREQSRSRTRAQTAAAAAADGKSLRQDATPRGSYRMSPALSPLRKGSPLTKDQYITHESEEGSPHASAKNGSGKTGRAGAPHSPTHGETDSRDCTATPMRRKGKKRESRSKLKDKDRKKPAEQRDLGDRAARRSAAVSTRAKKSSQAPHGAGNGSVSSYSYSSSSYSSYSSDGSLGGQQPRSPQQHSPMPAAAMAMVYPPMKRLVKSNSAERVARPAQQQQQHRQQQQRSNRPPVALQRSVPKCPPPPPSVCSASAQSLQGTTNTANHNNKSNFNRSVKDCKNSNVHDDLMETARSFHSSLAAGSCRRGVSTLATGPQLWAGGDNTHRGSRSGAPSLGPYMSFLPKSKLAPGAAPAHHLNQSIAHVQHVSLPSQQMHPHPERHHSVYSQMLQSRGPIIFNRPCMSVPAETEPQTRRTRCVSATASLARVGQQGEIQELIWRSGDSGAVGGHNQRGLSAHSTRLSSHYTSPKSRGESAPPPPPKMIPRRAQSVSSIRTPSAGRPINPPLQRPLCAQESVSASNTPRQGTLAGATLGEPPQRNMVNNRSGSAVPAFVIQLPHNVRHDEQGNCCHSSPVGRQSAAQ